MTTNRLERQREYQRQYRERKKQKRKPDRDEIARELLHYAIVENLANDREDELWQVVQSITERLVARGYDHAATATVFDEIIQRYAAGWTFQHKLHLRAFAETEADDEC